MDDRKLSVRTKFFYGLGGSAESINNWTFANLVLFYFERIWGVPGSLVGLALFIGMCVDAISDPVVGSISDNWRSPTLGRRHPFMYAGPLPMVICIYLLFNPPIMLGHIGMFLWLTIFVVFIRFCMTVFVIPWTALQAELSQDYVERSVIISYRVLIGYSIYSCIHLLAYRYIFKSTPDFSNGLFNTTQYPVFSISAGAAILVFTFLSTHFTRGQIPYLPVPTKEGRSFSLENVLREAKLVFANRSFRILFIAIYISEGFYGIAGTLDVYLNIYFWGLLPEQIALFGPFLLVGTVAGFLLIRPVGERYEKKTVLISTWAVWIVLGFVLILLRLLGLMLPNGHPWMLPLLIGHFALRIGIIIVAMTMWTSMIADALDEHELATNERQEGLFFSAIAFISKAMAGIGILVSGIILNLLDIPKTTAVESIDPGIIWNFGLVVGILIPIGPFFAIWLLTRYNLTKERHAEIRAQLDARAEDAILDPVDSGSGTPAK